MNDKRSKVIFIDPILQRGHIVFNQIYIDALNKENVELTFVFVKGYEKELKLYGNRLIYQIPKFFFKYNFGGFINRVLYLSVLLILKWKINFQDYDKVIFSSFEEISFNCSGIRNVVLINHINISQLNNIIKRVSFFKVLRKNTLIVFDALTKKYIDLNDEYKIEVIPHGITSGDSFKGHSLSLGDLNGRFKNRRFEKVIFSPSSNSSDREYVQTLITNMNFINYLKDNKILLVVKGAFISKEDEVLVIDRHVTNEEYNTLFYNSDIILIAYKNTFKYRVSGVLFECFALNKPCLVRRNNMLFPYLNYFTYNPYFDSCSGLMDSIDAILNNKDTYYKNLEELQPNFKNLINA